MERTIHIGGADVRMRASALIPRLYRFKFGRDLIKDMSILEESFKKAVSNQEQLSVIDLTIFENVAWCMAKGADKDIPDSPDDWLDGFDGVFSIYEALPQVLELWAEGLEQTSTPAKK